MSFPARTESKSLLTLPNELLFEVASNLESFEDLKSLLCTSRFFHTLFKTHLYRRAVAAADPVRADIARWVLSNYRIASLTSLMDNGLSVHQKLRGNGQWTGYQTLLQWLCGHPVDEKLSAPLAQLLIERGADITEKDPIDSSTPLHLAARKGNAGIIALLLENGAEIDARATYSAAETPLHFAARNPNQHSSIIDLLIANGAAVDARASDDSTPLHLAAAEGNIELIPTLLMHGADPRACDKERHTPLHHVIWRYFDSDHGMVKALLEHGADVNAADENGNTPLHLASAFSQSDSLWKVKVLLEYGANVNAHGSDGHSPLKEAFRKFRSGRLSCGPQDEEAAVAVIRLLIAHGADGSVLDSTDRAQAVRLGIEIYN
jgi:ankyrin repeat protein